MRIVTELYNAGREYSFVNLDMYQLVSMIIYDTETKEEESYLFIDDKLRTQWNTEQPCARIDLEGLNGVFGFKLREGHHMLIRITKDEWELSENIDFISKQKWQPIKDFNGRPIIERYCPLTYFGDDYLTSGFYSLEDSNIMSYIYTICNDTTNQLYRITDDKLEVMCSDYIYEFKILNKPWFIKKLFMR